MKIDIGKTICLVIVFCVIGACSEAQQSGANIRLDLEDPFAPLGTAGTLLLFDERTGAWSSNDYNRARVQYLPASTFKIPHALIALETRAIGPDEVLEWDGQDRGLVAWNQDHTLASAVAGSVVWFFQETARRIGEPEMRAWIEAFEYGNRRIGGGIDLFWLTGDLRISAWEQIDFFRRFEGGKLPVSDATAGVVKEAMLLAEGNNWQLYGKTGWASGAQPGIGWLAGYVVCEGGKIFYALNMDVSENKDLAVRKQIVFDIVPAMCQVESPSDGH